MAGNVLDHSIEAISRWSCKAEAWVDETCELALVFDEPQEIMEMRMSLCKGDQRTRSVNVWVDGDLASTITSSVVTTAYETYELNESHVTTITLQAVDTRDNGWLSVTGVSNNFAPEIRPMNRPLHGYVIVTTCEAATFLVQQRISFLPPWRG